MTKVAKNCCIKKLLARHAILTEWDEETRRYRGFSACFTRLPHLMAIRLREPLPT